MTEESYSECVKCLIFAWHMSIDGEGRSELRPASMLFELSQIAQNVGYLDRALKLANMANNNNNDSDEIDVEVDANTEKEINKNGPSCPKTPTQQSSDRDYIFYYNMAGIFLQIDSVKAFKDNKITGLDRTQNFLIKAAKLEGNEGKSVIMLKKLYCIKTYFLSTIRKMTVDGNGKKTVRIIRKEKP